MRLPAPAALVFDMDGLLLDTERLARDAFVASCREYGIEARLDVYHRCIGTTGARTREILDQGYAGELKLDAFSKIWTKYYDERVVNAQVPVKDGAVQLLARCVERGVRCALATSTHNRIVRLKLSSTGLGEYFEVMVTGDRVHNGKPHPEPYCTAVRELGLAPADCWALEDSENGVRSAHAAGLRVFQIPDLVEPPQALLDLGHTVFSSLRDVMDLLDECGQG